jgi:hypothetical protein
MKTLLGATAVPLWTPARRLQCRDPILVQQFNSYTQKHSEKYSMEDERSTKTVGTSKKHQWKNSVRVHHPRGGI